MTRQAMQRNGLEWLFRPSQEPQRLAKRDLVDSWAFLLEIGTDLRGGAGAPCGDAAL